MSSIQKAWIAIGVAIVLAGGLLLWQAKYNKPKDAIASLTKEDIATLVEGASPQALQRLKNDPAERKNVINQLRELLAFAAEARATGIDKDPKIKTQMSLNKSVALMNAYLAKAQKDNPTDPSVGNFKKEEIDAYLQRPGTDERFKAFVKEAQEAGQLPPGEMQEAQLGQLKEQWARVFIGEEKAIQAGLDKDRKTQLQVAIQQAVVLARAYSEKNVEKEKDKFTASEDDIAKWIAAHPEFDTKAKRAKAEELLKRAKSGEDFATLANENTDDPGNRDAQGKLQGGFYEFGRGQMDKNFEETSFNLQPGQVSELVETPYGYHIIKSEGKEKKKGPDGKEEEQVKVRHILISTMIKDASGGPGGRGEVPLKEKAKQEIEKEKRETFVKEIAAKHAISLPDDFDVVVPDIPAQMPGEGQQMPQPQPQGGGAEQPQPQPQSQPQQPESKKPAEKPKGGTKKGN